MSASPSLASVTMLTTSQQAITALFYIKSRLPPALLQDTFSERLDAHFVTLYGIFTELYGYRNDCLEHIVGLIKDLAESWADRPADLKQLDERRASNPEWFMSNKMLGGVCYVDRYAGSLAGIRQKIPYFQALGLTYLHLMPIFLAPQPKNDGGYAVSSYRELDPRVGTIQDLQELASELRAVGISLVIDFIGNHTSNEHEWAKRAVQGETEYEGYYWIFPDRSVPSAFEQTT